MIKVFYDDRQHVQHNQSFSPSAGKPAKVVADWYNHNLPIAIEPVIPLTQEEIALAHNPDYVNGVLSLRISNGFGNKMQEVADSLYWTNGSITSAARYAVTHQTQTVSPTSGFHHASYDSGGGFCTFNGLMIAAQILKQEGLLTNTGRIGILDLDQHYGNGTDDIISELSLDYVSHYTIGGGMLSHRSGEAFLEKLPQIFKEYFSDVDLLLYQAGADSCIDDPLGGTFTQGEMRIRDRKIFELCKEYRLPVAWNLAGGYQTPFDNVLALHRATLEEHLRVFEGISVNTGVEESYMSSPGLAFDWI